MAGLGTFLLEVGVDLPALQKGLNRAETSIENFGKKAEKVGTKISLTISAPLALLAKKAITAYGEMEALELSLGTIEKTASNLSSRLKELNEVAKLPGIGFKEAIQADVRLRAVGIAADISKRAMLAFGNAIATAGGGKAQFDSVIYQLAQMSAKSKVLSQDFRPIIEAVPMVATAVKKLYGTVDTEQIQSKMSKAGINSAQFINQLITELEKLPKVSGGVKNAIENLEDTLFKSFSKIGQTIDKNVGIQKWVENVGDALTGLSESFANLSPEAQKAVLAISGIAIVVPPLLAAIGAVAPAIVAGIGALASPIGLATIAVGALVAVWADYEITANRIANASKTLSQVEDDVRASIHNQGLEVSVLNDVLQSHNTTLEDKKKALDKLQKISPEYFGNLKAENLNYSDLNVSLSKYITNLENATKAQILKSKIDQNIKAESDILSNPTGQTSALDLIGAKTQQIAGRLFGNERYANSVVNTVVLNAANNLTELRLTRKEYEKEFKLLLKAGYGGDAPATGGSTSTGGGGTLSNAQIDAAKKLAEETKKVREDLLKDTVQAEINAMTDSFAKQRAEANKAYLEDIKAKKEAIQGKKGLDTEYTNWFVARYEEMQAKIRAIQVDEFKTPALIKRTLVVDTQNSLSGQLKSSGKVGASKIALKQTMKDGVAQIDFKSEVQTLEKYLKLAEGTINNANFSGYARQAKLLIDANQTIKDSWGEVAFASSQVMGQLIVNMATGTATITDLAKGMLASLGDIFSQVLAQMSKMAIIDAGIGLATFNPALLFKGIGLGIASGAVGAFSKKIGQGNASNRQTATTSQPSYSVVRGGDIFVSQNRYQTIKGF